MEMLSNPMVSSLYIAFLSTNKMSNIYVARENINEQSQVLNNCIYLAKLDVGF